MAACNFNSCNGCPYSEREFVRTFITEESFVEYYIAHGVLSCHTLCPMCGNSLKLNENLEFKCEKYRLVNKLQVKCEFVSSGRKGSFFENTSLSFDTISTLIQIFVSRKTPMIRFAEHQLQLSSDVIIDWFSSCGKVCIDFAFRRTGEHYDEHSAELYFKRCFPNCFHRFHEFLKAVAVLYPPMSHTLPPGMCGSYNKTVMTGVVAVDHSQSNVTELPKWYFAKG